MSGLSIDLPDAILDAIAERVLQRLGDVSGIPDTGYLDVAAAAEFLACPSSRIYALVSAGRIPHYRDGSRLLFDRAELRSYVTNGGANRP